MSGKEDAEKTLTDVLVASAGSDIHLRTPAAQTYLTHLKSLPLPTLIAEPTSLQTQSHHLTSSLTSLTHTSYPTFLSLHRTTASLSSSLDSLSSSLESLLDVSLPALEETSAAWKERTDAVLKERKKARVVLEQHDKIRDLLDIPLLIDTCVRNGYFSEALSLASHATSLSSSSQTPPLMLTSVLAEVHQSVTQMLLSLLATLHEPNRKLPALWKAVNFLRKMDVFGEDSNVHAEEQIALAFLGGREACLKTSLEGCGRDVHGLISVLSSGGELGDREKDDIAKYLKKYIDVWREGVYDIITQFTTIFLERPSTASANPGSPRLSFSARARRPSSPSPRTQNSNPPDPIPASLRPLLTTYTTHALHIHLLPILFATLPSLPMTSLPSILTQLTYCATAFARVGMDFRGVLGSIFSSAVATSIGKELQESGKVWDEKIRSKVGGGESESNVINKSGRRGKAVVPPSQWLIVSSLVASPPTPSSTTQSSPPHVPPQILASYPPLAEFTNALLSVFNGLRLLAPVDIMHELVDILEGILKRAGTALFGYARAVVDAGLSESKNGGERAQEDKIARAIGEVYVRIFVPFIRRALVEGVYGITGSETKEEDFESDLNTMVKEWERWLSDGQTEGQ